MEVGTPTFRGTMLAGADTVAAVAPPDNDCICGGFGWAVTKFGFTMLALVLFVTVIVKLKRQFWPTLEVEGTSVMSSECRRRNV